MSRELTPEEAIAIRALWLTLAEEGNVLASSWARLIRDVEPLELIKVTGTLLSQIPRIGDDLEELAQATAAIIDRPARGPEPDAGILEELIQNPAGPAAHQPPKPHAAGTGGPEIEPIQPTGGPQEASNTNSGPTTPEKPKINGIWAPLAALLIDHPPELVGAMAPASLEELLDALDELMQRARLWDEYTLEELGTRWQGQADWAAVPSYDLRTFAQRVVIQATAEVEATGLGSRAMRHRRKEETNEHTELEA